MLIYLLAEIKIVLYSKTKSKISEALLQAFQIMQPFEYVNPLLMAAFKEDYEEYLSAPMSIVMGLWGEHRNRSNRRKIELFINKKCNWF